MRMLVDAGASTEATSKDGWTPLHFAAINGKANAVVLLAQGGADLNAVNQAGDTALHLAIRNNCLGVADELLRLGALNTLVNAQGQLAWDFCLNPGAKDLLSSCDKDGRLKELLNKRVAQQLTTQTEAANWEGDALGLLPPGASGNTVDDSRATAQLAGMDQEWSGSPEGAARDAAGSISGWSEGGADQGGAGQAGFVPAKRAALLARYRQQAVAAAKDVDSGPDSLSMSRASGFGPAASSGGWSQNTNAAAIASSAAAFTSRRNLLDKGVAARNSTTAHDEPATKAAAGGAATKAAAGGTGGSKTGLKGPAKNKKFLERYGLDKMQLFSP